MISIKLGKIRGDEITNVLMADKGFQAALRDALAESKRRIGAATVRAFRRTNVGRGLMTGSFNGNPEMDVKAHLGFDDAEATVAYEAIAEVLQQALEIAPLRKDRSVIRIRVSYTDLDDYVLDNASFVSYASDGGEVNWLQWLIKGGDTIGFGIVFGDKATSRSERAVMVKVKNGPEWDISDYGKFAENDNFIVDIFLDERWQEDVQEILDNSVIKALRKI